MRVCNGECQEKEMSDNDQNSNKAMKEELQEMRAKVSEYEQKVFRMERQLQGKNYQILKLYKTINQLVLKAKINQQSQSKSNSQTLTKQLSHTTLFAENNLIVGKNHHNLSLHIQHINNSSSLNHNDNNNKKNCNNNNSNNNSGNKDSNNISNSNKTIDQSTLCPPSPTPSQIQSSDPIFKIPSLSPTMIHLKSIQNIQAQRRKKLRLLKHNPNGTKLLVSNINSIAAGIPSSLSQELIKQAINPAKNKFIRKPMSPVMGSLLLNIKSSKTQTSIIIQNDDTPKQQTIKEYGEFNAQTQEKLGQVPYFLSLKKGKQH